MKALFLRNLKLDIIKYYALALLIGLVLAQFLDSVRGFLSLVMLTFIGCLSTSFIFIKKRIHHNNMHITYRSLPLTDAAFINSTYLYSLYIALIQIVLYLISLPMIKTVYTLEILLVIIGLTFLTNIMLAPICFEQHWHKLISSIIYFIIAYVVLFFHIAPMSNLTFRMPYFDYFGYAFFAVTTVLFIGSYLFANHFIKRH
ncbi:hypothetical protein [Staphylococcus massiliensis]|uniref:Uncharacterized protein n=2 Tax=Staphylococcus massiliensis TaxID=555791 RepID=K9AVT2_9STAP|nr:hypothetical protein [Staphylococcus massiliensis]EKU45600.1 hypothetical protein C273_11001 [Staphylococcus massiliensis S46]PNZ97933.1 hypothetical protein CD133_09760 [Staphylococcus massiliensis CCUG 55927]